MILIIIKAMLSLRNSKRFTKYASCNSGNIKTKVLKQSKLHLLLLISLINIKKQKKWLNTISYYGDFHGLWLHYRNPGWPCLKAVYMTPMFRVICSLQIFCASSSSVSHWRWVLQCNRNVGIMYIVYIALWHGPTRITIMWIDKVNVFKI